MDQDLSSTFASALATGAARRDVETAHPRLLWPSAEGDRATIIELAASPSTVVVDTLSDQLEEIVRSRAPRAELGVEEVRTGVHELLAGEPEASFGVWAYYAWSRTLVHVLPEALHRELRLDRNRYKITPSEQSRLLSLRIAIAGLSVGRAVSSTLAREGIGAHFRLADFDTLSLSNLNRVSGGVLDVGVNKTVLAAREIAELDPWARVDLFPRGVVKAEIEAFLDGIDVLVDECDDLAMKLELREAARARKIPVVMATSDRGCLDIERFDREPDRQPFHGVLPGVRAADLAGLTTKQKVPYVLRILDAARLEPRMAASLVEVKETLSTWPQLASSVALGGAMVASAIRRIALGEIEHSGRHEVDLDAIVGDQTCVPIPAPEPWLPAAVATEPPTLSFPPAGTSPAPTDDEIRFVVRCATLAPSGGNVQPWRFDAASGVIRCGLDPKRKATFLDFGDRASVLALGAALEAAALGAEALGFDASVVVSREPSPFSWELSLTRSGRKAEVTTDLERLRLRCCNRMTEPSAPIAAHDLEALAAAASPLETFAVKDADAMVRLGGVLGALDRVRFLSRRMHAELVSEIRWSEAEALATRDGIDLASLQLDATDLAALDVLRSSKAMHFIGELGLGGALTNGARKAFRSSGAALVVTTRETEHAAMIHAGRRFLRLWLEATARGLAVHPWGTPFLFQCLASGGESLSLAEREALAAAARDFAGDVPLERDQTVLFVLRLSRGRGPTARSIRRHVDDVLTFEGRPRPAQ